MEEQCSENSQVGSDTICDPRIRDLMILASIRNQSYSGGEGIKTANDLYYERVFLQMINGEKMYWNFAAMVLSLTWMFYRKMYGASVLCLFLSLLLPVSIMMGGWLLFPEEIMPIFYLIGFLSPFLLMGAFGNYMYYRHLLKKIKKGYHQVGTLKNVDLFSVIASFIIPCIGFITGPIISLLDGRKVRKFKRAE